MLRHLGIVPGVNCKRSCPKSENEILSLPKKELGSGQEMAKATSEMEKGYTDTLEATKGPSYGGQNIWSMEKGLKSCFNGI